MDQKVQQKTIIIEDILGKINYDDEKQVEKIQLYTGATKEQIEEIKKEIAMKPA